MPCRMEKKRRRRAVERQLTLTERDVRAPHWTMLPPEIQREVMELLLRLLRNEAVAAEGADDE